MFEIAAKPFIDIKKYRLLYVYHSMNSPLISPGAGEAVQVAKATLMALQSPAKTIEIFAGLFFPDSGQRILYKMEPFQVEAFAEKFPQAQTYVEQMGFLLDNTNFEKVTADEKTHLIRTIPFFYEDVELFYQALSPDEVQFRKRKMDGSGAVASDDPKVFLEQYLRIMSML